MKQSRTQIRRDLIHGAKHAPRTEVAVNREQLACALCDREDATVDDDHTIRRRKRKERKQGRQPTPVYINVNRQTVIDALRDQKPDAIEALRKELKDEPVLGGGQAPSAEGNSGDGKHQDNQQLGGGKKKAA